MKLSKFIAGLGILVTISSSALAYTITYNGEVQEYTGPNVSLVLNDTLFTPSEGQMPCIIVEDRTLVPVREVVESLGGTVNWDEETKTVSIEINNNIVELVIDSKFAKVNGSEEELDVTAKIINNKTMVPVRFIAEKCGFTVNWDDSTKTVSIKNDEIIEIEEKEAENIIIPAVYSMAAQSFNEKFSKNFGESKGKTVTYQLVDLIISNNVGTEEHAITVEFEDEKGNITSSNKVPEIHEIKSNIIKSFMGRYEVTGETAEDGFLNKISIKRVLEK